MISTGVFAATSEKKISKEMTIEKENCKEIVFACCRRSATDEEGNVLVSVSVCNSGNSQESQISSCLQAEEKLNNVIAALMPA